MHLFALVILAPLQLVLCISEDKETLTTAGEVLTTLGDASRETFTRKFLKYNESTIYTALKGVSLVASVFTGTLEITNEESEQLLNKVIEGMEKLAQKVYSNEKLIFNNVDCFDVVKVYKGLGIEYSNKTYINGVKHDWPTVEFLYYDVCFKAGTVFPANKTTHSMMDFIKDNSPANKKKFLADWKERSWDGSITWYAGELLRSKTDSSRFNKKIIDELAGNITVYLFQQYVINFFATGVRKTNNEYIEQQDSDYHFFIYDRKLHLEVFQEMSSNYYGNYFPGIIRQDIVRPAIDKIRENNCMIAANISNELKARYPWRKYAVIVSDAVRQKSQFAYYGFPKRVLVDDDYNEKTVIIFMATKEYEKNRENYSANKGREETIHQIESNFDGYSNIYSTIRFAKKGKNRHQISAVRTDYNPCMPPLNSIISGSFVIKVKWCPEISVSVIF